MYLELIKSELGSKYDLKMGYLYLKNKKCWLSSNMIYHFLNEKCIKLKM